MAVDTETTTTSITVATSLIVAIDDKVKHGEFANRDEAIAFALSGFIERRTYYDALIQEGLDDVAAGRVIEATPEFYRNIIDEVEAEIAAGRPAEIDEAIVGPLDVH